MMFTSMVHGFSLYEFKCTLMFHMFMFLDVLFFC